MCNDRLLDLDPPRFLQHEEIKLDTFMCDFILGKTL